MPLENVQVLSCLRMHSWRLTWLCVCCRVWSVAHSQHRPNLCASSSDDGTAHLWAGRGLSQRAGQISIPGSVPISCVSFCPEDENALALAASDCCAYVYDIRNLSEPLQVHSSRVNSGGYTFSHSCALSPSCMPCRH